MQTLAKCFALASQPQIPEEQKGRTKCEMFLGLKTLEFISHKETAPAGEVPPEEAALLTRTPRLPRPTAEEHFHTCEIFTPGAPHLPHNKPQQSPSRGDTSGTGCSCISPEHSPVPGTSDSPGRCSGSRAAFPSPSPSPMVVWFGGTSVQSLCPAAQTQHLWTYSGCGLTVFIEETKSNWTKSVFC